MYVVWALLVAFVCAFVLCLGQFGLQLAGVLFLWSHMCLVYFHLLLLSSLSLSVSLRSVLQPVCHVPQWQKNRMKNMAENGVLFMSRSGVTSPTKPAVQHLVAATVVSPVSHHTSLLSIAVHFESLIQSMCTIILLVTNISGSLPVKYS